MNWTDPKRRTHFSISTKGIRFELFGLLILSKGSIDEGHSLFSLSSTCYRNGLRDLFVTIGSLKIPFRSHELITEELVDLKPRVIKVTVFIKERPYFYLLVSGVLKQYHSKKDHCVDEMAVWIPRYPDQSIIPQPYRPNWLVTIPLVPQDLTESYDLRLKFSHFYQEVYTMINRDL